MIVLNQWKSYVLKSTFQFLVILSFQLLFDYCFYLQTNLVASGANESEIYIWDLNNFATPMTPGAKTQVY